MKVVALPEVEINTGDVLVVHLHKVVGEDKEVGEEGIEQG